jgi:hypothetical protein
MTARPQILFLLAMILIFAGCNKSYDEKIGGVEIPIPHGMKKSDGAGLEVALLGFGGGQSSFRGQLEAGKVIEFYEKEMPGTRLAVQRRRHLPRGHADLRQR